MKKACKGLSAVIATVILILLVVVATAIVWGFVSNIIKEKTEGTQSCFDVTTSEKVTINNYYTCFNSTSGEIQFSINIGDVEIDSLIVSILTEGSSKSFTLTNEASVIPDLKPYQGSPGEAVKLPEVNAGITYIASGFSGAKKIDWIKIAPVVEGKQCDATDTIYEIADCADLVG